MDWWREREAMLEFALRWAPFGGGDSEDIWVSFGVTEQVYFARLQIVLHGDPPAGLDTVLWERLRRVCARRLAEWPTSTPTP